MPFNRAFLHLSLVVACLTSALASTHANGNMANASVSASDKVICPPQKGAAELTFSRLMMNLGRFTLKADSLTREISQSGQSRESAEAAANDLVVAIACAQVAVDAALTARAEHAVGQELSPAVAVLLPTGISKISGDDRTKYLTRYEHMMFGYQSLLEEYLLQIQSGDYAEAFKTSIKARKLTDHGHDKLNTSTFCEKALEPNR